MTGLRIGILCHDGVGGSVRIATDLARLLAVRGHEIHVFSRRPPLEVRSRPGLTLHTLEGPAAPGRLAATLDPDWPSADIDRLAGLVAGVAQRQGLDVLHFHYAVPFAAVAERVRGLLGGRAPAVAGTLHGTDVSVLGLRPGPRRRLAASLAQADALTTVSASHAALATRIFGLQAPPVVIPNFVDPARFRPAPAREEGPPRIAHVSNFRAVKQPVAVARIFAEVRRRVDAELWLVGDGSEAPRMRAVLAEEDLLGATRWFGLRLDLDAILPGADLLLVTSRTESFCLASLEAGACGVPTVAPRVGGLVETVRHGETGLLFEPGDRAGAADAVQSLLRDGDRLRAMGEAAVRRASVLSEDAVVPRYEELYASIGQAPGLRPALAGGA